jgi:hypothetical protein
VNASAVECLSCIDGFAPTTDELLGYAFRACPACRIACSCCNGRGVYPVWTQDMTEFAAVYNAAGFAPVICHTCGGVVDVAPLDEETPHGH